MNQNIILQVEALVKEACLSDTNVFGYGIWTHHITRVVKIARELARTHNADEEIVIISALLHDYAGIKDFRLHKNHHIHGSEEAERILLNLNYPRNKIEAVKNCILTHRGSSRLAQKSVEAVCLTDADAIAHIEGIPSLLFFAYTKRGMEIDEGSDWIIKKIGRSWSKLSEESKQLMQEKYDGAKLLLTRD